MGDLRTPGDRVAVSVIVPAHNEAENIVPAIDSIEGPPGVDIEILVVDDRSTDDTRKIVEGLADRRVRLLQTPPGAQGPSAARNRGLDTARGEWVAFLDGDDTWKPGRLDAMLRAARQATADLVADDVIEQAPGVAAHGARERTLLGERRLTVDGPWVSLTIDDFVRYDFGVMKPTIRRSLIESHRIRFRDEQSEDFSFWLRCLLVAESPILMADAYYCHLRDGGRETLSTPTPEFWIASAASTTALLTSEPGLAGSTRRLLERRQRRALRRHHYMTARRRFESGHRTAAIRHLTRHPSSLLVAGEEHRTRILPGRRRVLRGS